MSLFSIRYSLVNMLASFFANLFGFGTGGGNTIACGPFMSAAAKQSNSAQQQLSPHEAKQMLDEQKDILEKRIKNFEVQIKKRQDEMVALNNQGQRQRAVLVLQQKKRLEARYKAAIGELNNVIIASDEISARASAQDVMAALSAATTVLKQQVNEVSVTEADKVMMELEDNFDAGAELQSITSKPLSVGGDALTESDLDAELEEIMNPDGTARSAVLNLPPVPVSLPVQPKMMVPGAPAATAQAIAVGADGNALLKPPAPVSRPSTTLFNAKPASPPTATASRKAQPQILDPVPVRPSPSSGDAGIDALEEMIKI